MTDANRPTEGGNTEPLLIHYGPIYDRPLGESLALCSPVGGFATMSNHWPSVNCERCKDKGFYL